MLNHWCKALVDMGISVDMLFNINVFFDISTCVN